MSRLRSRQAGYFNEVGIIADDQSLSIPFLGGKIQFQIEDLGKQPGSFFSKHQITVTVNSAKHFGRDLFIAVLAHLLVTATFGHIPQEPRLPVPPPVHYVCTVDGNIPGDPELLIDAAKQDLDLTQALPQNRTRGVWKSRQICLKAAGFDPGPIDGIRGAGTIRAEDDFEFFHKVKVNWNSQVFQRYIIKMAQDNYSAVAGGNGGFREREKFRDSARHLRKF
jgi:hypothetical protein